LQGKTLVRRITPIDDQRCRLRITGRVDFIKKLPFPIRWALIKFKMKPIYSQYIFQILEDFVFFVEIGQQVKRNQFGPHPIMTPQKMGCNVLGVSIMGWYGIMYKY